MHQRKSKQLRRKAEALLIDWIRTMVPEGEDATRINRKNLQEFLPAETHIFANNKFMISAYSLRWFYKQVKRNPDITLEELSG
jgi:hypothetical protein